MGKQKKEDSTIILENIEDIHGSNHSEIDEDIDFSMKRKKLKGKHNMKGKRKIPCMALHNSNHEVNVKVKRMKMTPKDCMLLFNIKVSVML